MRENCPGGAPVAVERGTDDSAGVSVHAHTARGRSAATKRHLSHVLCTCMAHMDAQQPHSKIFAAFRTENLD